MAHQPLVRRFSRACKLRHTQSNCIIPGVKKEEAISPLASIAVALHRSTVSYLYISPIIFIYCVTCQSISFLTAVKKSKASLMYFRFIINIHSHAPLSSNLYTYGSTWYDLLNFRPAIIWPIGKIHSSGFVLVHFHGTFIGRLKFDFSYFSLPLSWYLISYIIVVAISLPQHPQTSALDLAVH